MLRKRMSLGTKSPQATHQVPSHSEGLAEVTDKFRALPSVGLSLIYTKLGYIPPPVPSPGT